MHPWTILKVSGVPFVNLPNATDLGRSLERCEVNRNGSLEFFDLCLILKPLMLCFFLLLLLSFIFRTRYPYFSLFLCCVVHLFAEHCFGFLHKDLPVFQSLNVSELHKDFGGWQRWWKSMHRLAAGPAGWLPWTGRWTESLSLCRSSTKVL